MTPLLKSIHAVLLIASMVVLPICSTAHSLGKAPIREKKSKEGLAGKLETKHWTFAVRNAGILEQVKNNFEVDINQKGEAVLTLTNFHKSFNLVKGELELKKVLLEKKVLVGLENSEGKLLYSSHRKIPNGNVLIWLKEFPSRKWEESHSAKHNLYLVEVNPSLEITRMRKL